MVVTCRSCSAMCNVGAADRLAGVTPCEQCGALIDLTKEGGWTSAMSEQPAPARRHLEAPPGIAVAEADRARAGYRGAEPTGAITITRRRRRRSRGPLAIRGAALAVLVALWLADAFAIGSVALAVVLAPITALVSVGVFDHLCRLVNRAVIRADGTRLAVEHGPLPSHFHDLEIPLDDLRQLYAAERRESDPGVGPYQLRALLVRDVMIVLVDGLDTPDEALFLEQQLEAALGITDHEVATELPREGGQGVAKGYHVVQIHHRRSPWRRLWRYGLALLVWGIPAVAVAVHHDAATLARVDLEDEPRTMRFEVTAERPDVYLATDVDIAIGDLRPENELPAVDAIVRLRRVDGEAGPIEMTCEITRRDETSYTAVPAERGRDQHVAWHGRLDHCPLDLEPGTWEASVTRRWRHRGEQSDRTTRSELRVEARR